MSSVTSFGDCPNCGATAQSFYESKSFPSVRIGVVVQCDEWLLGCGECGYYEDSKSELHSDGRWYTYETKLRPHDGSPRVGVEELATLDRCIARVKECLVMLYNDGTVIPIDSDNRNVLYRKGENGVLVPLRDEVNREQSQPDSDP